MSGLIHGALYGVIVLGVALSIAGAWIWGERKFAARLQTRLGPTIVGPFGLLQAVADVLKLLQKEDIIPAAADRALFNIAPVLAAFCALGVAAVVPFGPDLMASDLDIGVIFVLALGALTTIAIFLGGWASNNKFAMLGGMRAVAQAISYEVPLVLAAMVPVILAGSLSVNDIVKWQAAHHMIALWPVIPGLPAFALFYMAMLAESNRIPFDIPEAESELVGGITTEYTGMKFTLFYMAEYIHTLVGSAVASALFLGGWDGPGAPGPHWMIAKTLLLFVSVYWVRWSLIRFRSDQLLTMCWRYLVPASVLLVLAAALWVQLFPEYL
jgi:NADH-quinone oxidoreductase subunit H